MKKLDKKTENKISIFIVIFFLMNIFGEAMKKNDFNIVPFIFPIIIGVYIYYVVKKKKKGYIKDNLPPEPNKNIDEFEKSNNVPLIISVIILLLYFLYKIVGPNIIDYLK